VQLKKLIAPLEKPEKPAAVAPAAAPKKRLGLTWGRG
jgi:hypothetical protein